MTTGCERLRADAPGIASLAPDDPERVAAWAHARGCPECARALREGERLQLLIAAAAPEPLPAGALERASRAILDDLRRGARRRSLAAAAAAAGAFAAFVVLARHASRAPGDWAAAAVLALGAVGLAAGASRRPLLAAVGAVGAVLAAAVALGGPGPLELDEGVRCVATELAGAAAVLAAGWAASRRSGGSPSRLARVASAVAGALAGDAALQITCSAQHSAPHLLAFHLGGVLLAAAAASALDLRPARAAA